MMKKRLPYYPGIQIFQRTGIAVELLPGRDTLCRDVDPLTFVVFPDTLMGLVMVVVLDKQCPPMAGFLKSLFWARHSA